MNPINIKSLPLSSKVSICWGFFWRGIVVSLGSALCGGGLGALVGFILGLAGATEAAGTVVGGVLGIGCGAFFLYLLLLWLLSSHLGSYKLVLVSADETI